MTRFSNPWGLQVICMRPDRGAPRSPPFPPGGCDIIDLRITCALRLSIHTCLHVACLCFCPDSMMVCSHGALSGVWMLLLLRRCSHDAQILPAGAATRCPSRRTEHTDGRTACATRRFPLLQCCRRLMERGKKENSRNGVFLWRIFAFWRNNHNTK